MTSSRHGDHTEHPYGVIKKLVESPSNLSLNPEITILICVKDRVQSLIKCFESLNNVLNECSGQLLIVCDGGNSDVRIAQNELRQTNEWTVEWLDVEQGGPAKARNQALPLIKGKVVLFLNDDVIVEEGLLKEHLKSHTDYPGHAVMGNTRWPQTIIDSEFMHWVAHHDSFYYLISQKEATWEYFHTMNVSVDNSWFQDKGFSFDESFPDPAFEDTDLGYRLTKAGMKIRMNYRAILYHDHHFTYEQYRLKAIMKGRSAKRFCDLHPELTERITGESSAKSVSLFARLLTRYFTPQERLDGCLREIHKAFMKGFNGTI